MSVAEATRSVYLELVAGCEDVQCHAFATPLHRQLSAGYEECSVLRLPRSIEDWQAENRTARKRTWRAERLGYRFSEIVRHEFVDDVYAINTSKTERQGRPMSAGYSARPSETPDPDYPCLSHGVHPYGVLLDDTLVAYLWCYRSGDMALVSSILGHGEHLRFDVMYLLMRGTIEAELVHGGFLVYNRHDSGTDGLRFYKERCGFEPAEVQWAL
jgi:hypothetical protein